MTSPTLNHATAATTANTMRPILHRAIGTSLKEITFVAIAIPPRHPRASSPLVWPEGRGVAPVSGGRGLLAVAVR